jgi:beta-glucanase (GH16 family)
VPTATRSTTPSWPCGGEIDFSEGTSADIRRTGFYYHYGCTNKQTQVSIPNDTSVWRTYAVQWTRYGVTGYIDGRVWFQD